MNLPQKRKNKLMYFLKVSYTYINLGLIGKMSKSFQIKVLRLMIRKEIQRVDDDIEDGGSLRVEGEERERCHILTTLAGWMISHEHRKC